MDARICLGADAYCHTAKELSETSPRYAHGRKATSFLEAARFNGLNETFAFAVHCCARAIPYVLKFTHGGAALGGALPTSHETSKSSSPIFVDSELQWRPRVKHNLPAACLGWRGLLIEAQPSAFADLPLNRPGAVTIHSAVSDACSVNGTASFVQSLSTRGTMLTSKSPMRQVSVPCAPLSHYLTLMSADHVSFLSLDVEGGELNVLRSIDWERQSVSLLVVEELKDDKDLEKNRKVAEFLRTQTRMQWLFQGCWHPRACDAYWFDPRYVDAHDLLARNSTYSPTEPSRKGRHGAINYNGKNGKCTMHRDQTV